MTHQYDTTAQTILAARIGAYTAILRAYGTTPAEHNAAEHLELLPPAIARLSCEHPEIILRSTKIAQESHGFALAAMQRHHYQQQQQQQQQQQPASSTAAPVSN